MHWSVLASQSPCLRLACCLAFSAENWQTSLKTILVKRLQAFAITLDHRVWAGQIVYAYNAMQCRYRTLCAVCWPTRRVSQAWYRYNIDPFFDSKGSLASKGKRRGRGYTFKQRTKPSPVAQKTMVPCIKLITLNEMTMLYSAFW